MNRRIFLIASAGLAASGGFGRAIALGDRHSVAAGPVVAIVDASLDESVAWARSAIAYGASVIDGGDDVGALWYRALTGARVSVVGALRASDFFVVRYLARSEGRTVVHESGSAGVVAFRIDALS
ncbi:hypothetical protein B0G57_101195 [Trinickia symbiotica]|uniref:Uncharacterized protein n=1 Tax=Trinickia symbiotica TaxID=863227 RepID=A0A2N7X8L6_9BURK|nr:hypothetical protein [Trinickia symbiotica]PMS38099.1 hypothetical protein C0Z20_04710 [Trinickia symbiotica]PPK47231.1 hypothetical protein B0G57_101195 [Trinickia symbiotica]